MKNTKGNIIKSRTMIAVVFKSSGKIANKFTSLGQAKHWMQENDTLYTGENGRELQDNAGLFEIKRIDVQ